MANIWDPDALAIEVDELVTVAMEAAFRWRAGRPPLLDTPLQRNMHRDIVRADLALQLDRMRARVRH